MKVVLKSIVLVWIITIIVGCVAQQQTIYLKSNYDENYAKRIFEPGNNKITGSALIRQAGGGVVSCAGTEVQLLPVTEYANERIKFIYGNTEKGYLDIQTILRNSTMVRHPVTGALVYAHNYVFEPDLVTYKEYCRKTLGDSQGNFEFDKLVDGDYFIIVNIVWGMSQSTASGGYLMLKVHVEGGEVKKVVLAP